MCKLYTVQAIQYQHLQKEIDFYATFNRRFRISAGQEAIDILNIVDALFRYFDSFNASCHTAKAHSQPAKGKAL